MQTRGGRPPRKALDMTAAGTTRPVGTATITIVGVFDGVGKAERALNGLKDAGFAPEQVSVVAKEREDTQHLAERTDMAGEGAAAGAVTGGLLGGLTGFLVGVSALVIPGIGPIVGAGILGATLVGAGVGAATGGLVGALAGQGVPEEDARAYEAHVKGGRILLSVQAADAAMAQQAREIFDRAGGEDVRRYGDAV
jgi:uncharacterized membrane protein